MPLNYGKMNEKEIQCANSIGMHTIGVHFSPEVSKYLIELIRVHTWPLDTRATCCPKFVRTATHHEEWCVGTNDNTTTE